MVDLANLNALRAFEAAARNGSYVAAARELNVTPAAIGQHVRALEAWLGLPLFVRSNAGGSRIAPTPTAILALPELRNGFERLASGLSRLREASGRGVLTVTATQSFVSKWLLPRLEGFQATHPNIELRLDVTDRLADFSTDGVEVGIRYGDGSWRGLSSHSLLREDIFPVCAAALISGRNALRKPSDLEARVLIHDTTVGAAGLGFPTWRDWFSMAGLNTAKAERGLRINSSAAVLQAAMAGRGVALARSVLVADDLANGSLVRPFAGLVLPLKQSWYIVHRPEIGSLAKVCAFKVWIADEARR